MSTLVDAAIHRPVDATAAPNQLRVAVVADLEEERWVSMELAADVLLARFGRGSLGDIRATRLRPAMRRRLTRLPAVGATRRADTADRVINRFWDYPRWLRQYSRQFDLFHIVDHTYAHLALSLPAGRTVITVHDVDAFLALVDPGQTRSTLPRAFVSRLVRGLQSAAWVICVSEATRTELSRYTLFPLDRTSVVHNGVDAAFSPERDPASDAAITALIGPPSAKVVDIVHCGTTIRRKRIDVLLTMLAGVRSRDMRVRLLKVGGALTPEQADRARQLKVDDAIVTLPFLPSRQLAALYRRSRVAVITSDREGFCLPLVEALACGTAVVASDIPVLREVGGQSCVYAPVGEIEPWTVAVTQAIESRARGDDTRRVVRASAYNWDRHAASVAEVYRQVEARVRPPNNVRGGAV